MVENISLFINPQSMRDGKLLRDVNLTYNFKEPSGNIDLIDGIVVSMKDWRNVSKGLQYRVGSLDKIRRPLYDRQLIIDPDLWHLFGGYGLNAERLLRTKIFSSDAIRAYKEVSIDRDKSNKLFRQVSEIYPTLDKKYIKGSLEFQNIAGTNLLISPSPPITSVQYLDTQLQKMQEMNEISKNYVDSGLVTSNLMNMLTINPNIFDSPNTKEKLLTAVSKPRTNFLGIKLLDLNYEDISQAKELIYLIREIKKRSIAVEIYLFNVLEFGYVTFCHGVNTIVMPMWGRWPYIRARRKLPRTKWGTYYHPKDMIYYSHRNLLAETRDQNYRFPCHCKACSHHKNIPRIRDEDSWNNFRRIHFMLAKNMDIFELRKAPAPLNNALIDKFSRSKQTVWVPLLEL